MSTLVQSPSNASAPDTTASPSVVQSPFQQVMDALLSGKGLRLALVAGAVFLAWNAFQGMRSLFWAIFGIAWVLFWTHGSSWF
jgi:hypothetical protein